MSGIRVMGGRMDYKLLNLNLMKNEKVFMIAKIHIWLSLLKENMVPVRWYKTTKKGTGVKFELLNSKEKAQSAINELRSYVDSANNKYPELKLKLDIELN